MLGRIVTEGAQPTLISRVGSYFDAVQDYQVVVDSAVESYRPTRRPASA